MLSGIPRLSNESLRESGCRNELATKQDHGGIAAVRLLLQYPPSDCAFKASAILSSLALIHGNDQEIFGACFLQNERFPNLAR